MKKVTHTGIKKVHHVGQKEHPTRQVTFNPNLSNGQVPRQVICLACLKGKLDLFFFEPSHLKLQINSDLQLYL